LLGFHEDANNPATLTLELLGTQTAGSVMILGQGGTRLSFATPVDSVGNLYRQVGSILTYQDYPESGNAMYVAAPFQGSPRLTVASTKQSNANLELTFNAVEVLNASSIIGPVISYERAGQTMTSASVTTTGPAVLLAWWWGDGSSGVVHRADPEASFTVLDEVLKTGTLVQCRVASRVVNAAGTYNVTWQNSINEGAILWLVAVQ
jgi:hypothetical protein